MFCNSCGQALAYNSGHCTNCGIALPASPVFSPPVKAIPNTRLSYLEPRGVGGWLLYFWIALVISVFLHVSGAMRAQIPLVAAIEVGMAVLFSFCAYYVWQEDPKAIDLFRILLAITLVRAFLVFAIVQYQLPFRVTRPDRRSDATIAEMMVVRVLIWWLYFHTSVRVRNTFGRNV